MDMDAGCLAQVEAAASAIMMREQGVMIEGCDVAAADSASVAQSAAMFRA
jgi:hypothetical protein